MAALFFTVIARIRHFVRPAAGDAEFDQELELHLAAAEEDKVRRGMSREQARREARLELGGAAQLREAARAARGLPWLETLWLDARLGLRMLRRSWGLTLVGGLAMAVTIGLGASIFTIWDTVTVTTLPLDEGDRVVALQTFDKASQRVRRDTPLPDFRRWRDTMTSVEHASAMRPFDPAVIARDDAFDAVLAAEMTASAFKLARVQPLLGRPLLEDDEREDAEPVAVIGYRLWQEGFSSDPAVLGQRIQIGDTPHVVVGVMPEAFRFPVNQRLWTPLRRGPADGGPDAFVFARLAPGATLERAQAEVATLGLLPRDAAAGTAALGKAALGKAALGKAALGNTAQLEPRVVKYAAGFFPAAESSSWIAGVILLLAGALLLPPCANIAILVYARTVTRREEFAARTALGASRGRIVMQLFVEVLVLAAGAGVAGFFLARQFSGRLAGIVMPAMNPGNLPFWMDFRPSLVTVLCIAGLSVGAAAIAGAGPAFRITGRWSTGTPWRRSSGRHAGAFSLGHRAGGPRLGKTWMALLAAQVALSVVILPSAMEMLWGTFRSTIVGPGMPLEEFLTADLLMEGDTSRFGTLSSEAVRQLTSEAGIVGVATSTRGLMEEPIADIEVEGIQTEGVQSRYNAVDGRFFDVFGVRFLAGRGFDASDFGPGGTPSGRPAGAGRRASAGSSRREAPRHSGRLAGTPVIVNRTFVTEILGGANALGRRIQYREAERTPQVAPPTGWHEVVGIVEDFPASNDEPAMFHPMMGARQSVTLTIRSRTSVGQSADRLREVATRLDAQLRIGHLESFEETYWQRRSLDHAFGYLLGSVTLIVLLFSMAGIYTLMAFVVAQRRREIGVRAALGAQPRRLVIGIFGRAAVPLLIGAIAGSALALRLQSFLPIAEAGGRSIPGIVPMSVAVMIVVGLLAVTGPARRAIRIDPTEALRVI
jgi:putative ABC transport system permease protein